VARLEERLRDELERAARPPDVSGVYEQLIERRRRRRTRRTLEVAMLAVVVVAGSLGGVFALSRVFGSGDSHRTIGPLISGPFENGALAYTDGQSIVIVETDGTKRTVPSPSDGMAWHIAWSPDGQHLAVAMFADPGRSLWIMRSDGSDAIEIANADNVGRPSWTSDGARLTYSMQRDGHTEVHVVNADGSDDHIVVDQDSPGTYAVFSSTFSPDGTQIVFDAGTDSGYDIFVIGADGGDVRQITHTGTDYNPSWSPDGTQIVFTRQEDASESDVFVMDADGGDVQRLTDDGPRFTNLDGQFSPDGTKITFEHAENGGVGPIIVMHADGTDRRTLVDAQVLGFSWQPVAVGPTSPTPSLSPTVGGTDLGLGFPVCNVSSRDGTFFGDGRHQTAYVATRLSDTGDCPEPGTGYDVVAVDLAGDDSVDVSLGPIGCELVCRVFSAPDVDGDGTSEILVAQAGGSVLGLGLYDLVGSGDPGADGVALVRVGVAEPGDPSGGFRPGSPALLWLGGDGFTLDTLRCGTVPPFGGPGIVATSAESLPHDVVDAVWHAHEVTLSLGSDGNLHVLSTRDFTEPVSLGSKGPSFGSGETLCGSNLGP
jgi:hypothetical protein